jgi:hypothetical protein
LSRATKTIRAPIFASAIAATSPIPEVPPVMTTVFPLIAHSSVPSNIYLDTNEVAISAPGAFLGVIEVSVIAQSYP